MSCHTWQDIVKSRAVKTIRLLQIAFRNWSGCVHPCTCGFYRDLQKPCTCAHALVTKYQKRISGPLLDPIDLHIEMPRVDYENLSADRVGGPSSRSVPACKLRVTFKQDDMRIGEIQQFCRLPEEVQIRMRTAMTQLNLSARAYHRTRSLKLARTIVDLARCGGIQSVHLAEASQYRPKMMSS